MSDKSAIQWTDATWNPIAGCSMVSAGCTNCYAMREAHRLAAMGSEKYEGLTVIQGSRPVWNGKVRLWEKNLTLPLKWRARRVFVNSMSDLFHESVPDEAIDRVFAVMALAPQHTFQVLTKRAWRLREYLLDELRAHKIRDVIWEWHTAQGPSYKLSNSLAIHPLQIADDLSDRLTHPRWPLPNVWLGVSVEDQKTADERIPPLLQTHAAVRWISAEPLLGPIDLQSLPFGYCYEGRDRVPSRRLNCLKRTLHFYDEGDIETPALDWVVVGGESGPGARPMHPDWARKLRDQCQAAGVPFFFKQWGAWAPRDVAPHPTRHRDGVHYWKNAATAEVTDCSLRVGKKAAGRLLDGREWNEYPGSQGNEVQSAESA